MAMAAVVAVVENEAPGTRRRSAGMGALGLALVLGRGRGSSGPSRSRRSRNRGGGPGPSICLRTPTAPTAGPEDGRRSDGPDRTGSVPRIGGALLHIHRHGLGLGGRREIYCMMNSPALLVGVVMSERSDGRPCVSIRRSPSMYVVGVHATGLVGCSLRGKEAPSLLILGACQRLKKNWYILGICRPT